MPRSLQSRLLLTYLALAVLGLGGLISWTGLRLQQSTIEQTALNLELQAALIASNLGESLEEFAEGEHQEDRSLQSIVSASARSAGASVTVLDTRLRIAASSDETGEIRAPSVAETAHPELVAARAGLEQHTIRWDAAREEERMFAAAPVRSEHGDVEGVIELSIPTGPMDARIARTWGGLLAASGAALVATAAVSVVLARQMTQPIRTLRRVTERMAGGDVSQRVSASGPEEFARLGDAFNRMAEQVEETLARQRAFVADAAHELRSPLTGIRLRVDMLLSHGRDEPELAQSYLLKLQQEVDDLQRLVEHLLSLSRLDHSRPPSLQPMDLAPLLYELADEMAPLFQAAALSLRVDVPAHLPLVDADPDAARMMFRNLLDNAIQYTAAGGRVTLRGTDEGGMVRIAVSDTGQGIPAEHLSHIFDRFYRVDQARSRREGGAGLGLSLVRAIAEAHGGEVNAESAPGSGSTFTVLLPCHAPGMQAEAMGRAPLRGH